MMEVHQDKTLVKPPVWTLRQVLQGGHSPFCTVNFPYRLQNKSKMATILQLCSCSSVQLQISESLLPKEICLVTRNKPEEENNSTKKKAMFGMLLIHMGDFRMHCNQLVENNLSLLVKLNFTSKQMEFSHKNRTICFRMERAGINRRCTTPYGHHYYLAYVHGQQWITFIK